MLQTKTASSTAAPCVIALEISRSCPSQLDELSAAAGHFPTIVPAFTAGAPSVAHTGKLTTAALLLAAHAYELQNAPRVIRLSMPEHALRGLDGKGWPLSHIFSPLGVTS